MHKAVAVVVNGAADAVPNSIGADCPAAVVVHPTCNGRLLPVAIAENELTKALDDVECRATTPRAAALQRFLVIIVAALLLEILVDST